jgi:hypothetical protein
VGKKTIDEQWKKFEDDIRKQYGVSTEVPKFFDAIDLKGNKVKTQCLNVYDYMGVKLVIHKSLNSTKNKEFSVSHLKTGICFWPGFHYTSFKMAKYGTEVYLSTMIDEIFIELIEKAKDKLR